jgi:hypothetical protein
VSVFDTLDFIPLPPLFVGAAWLIAFVTLELRSRRAVRRGGAPVPWIDVMPYAIAVVLVQLFLDLHVRWLGEIVAGALHVLVFCAIWIRRRRQRRGLAAPPEATS